MMNPLKPELRFREPISKSLYEDSGSRTGLVGPAPRREQFRDQRPEIPFPAGARVLQSINPLSNLQEPVPRGGVGGRPLTASDMHKLQRAAAA